jgi:DNA-binding NarL/FixJ family response regulator
VLLDINLEGSEKNGIEFAQEYKEVYDFEVIFITAYFDSVTFAKANEVNPINYIIKPFKTSQISISLQLILTKINAHQEEGKDFDKTYLNKLTEEEKNVLYLISLGFSSKMISLYAKKSVKTVLNQRSNIVKKLELPNTNNSLLIWSLEHKSQITASVQE